MITKENSDSLTVREVNKHQKLTDHINDMEHKNAETDTNKSEGMKKMKDITNPKEISKMIEFHNRGLILEKKLLENRIRQIDKVVGTFTAFQARRKARSEKVSEPREQKQGEQSLQPQGEQAEGRIRRHSMKKAVTEILRSSQRPMSIDEVRNELVNRKADMGRPLSVKVVRSNLYSLSSRKNDTGIVNVGHGKFAIGSPAQSAA